MLLNFPLIFISLKFRIFNFVIKFLTISTFLLLLKKFFNEIIVEVRNIDSNQISFVVSRDGFFEFNSLSPGKYLLRAFENKNLINSEVYFSGLWNPYNEAATFGIYPDTIDVRSNWDIENINFKISNFIKE